MVTPWAPIPFSQFVPAVWPAIANKYIYTNIYVLAIAGKKIFFKVF